MEGVLIYKTYINNWSQYDVSEANEIKKTILASRFIWVSLAKNLSLFVAFGFTGKSSLGYGNPSMIYVPR